MRIRRRTVAVLCLVVTACLLCGCGHDPQVNVTPFVLKPSVAQPAGDTPPDGLVPGTGAYEEAMVRTPASGE